MKLYDLDLNLLRVLDALLAERNVTHAAQRLGLSQSTVSAALVKLRLLFDDELFIKRPHGVEATPRALALQAPLAEVMAAIRDTILSRAAFDPATQQRTFLLLFGELGQMLFAPRLLSVLRRVAPGVQLRVMAGAASQRLALFERGEVELAVGYFPEFSDSTLYQQRLYAAQPLVCVARADHPALADGALTQAVFAQLDHAVVGTEGGYPQLYEPVLRHLGIRHRVAIELSSLAAAAPVLADSDLIAVVPEGLARLMCHDGRFRMHPAPVRFPDCEVRQFWHRRLHHDPGLVWLRQLVATELGHSPLHDDAAASR